MTDLKALQTVVDSHTHTLSAHATVVALLHGLTEDRAQCLLGCEHDLRPSACLLQPLTDPLFALSKLVHIGGVDEITP